MNLDTLDPTVNYIFDNNLKLVEKGMPKIAINIVGDAGVGKTSIIEQIAARRGAKFVKLSLAQMEETGDFLGLPVKMYAMQSPVVYKKDEDGLLVLNAAGKPIIEKESEEVWVAEKTIETYMKLGYELCPSCEPRMDYAVPSWVPLHEEGEVIVLLDDYTRANNIILQGIMNLVQCGEFGTWKLPKKCHIVLTSNFDNGVYNLNSVDAAMTSRMVNFVADFDEKVFARWADSVGMRSEFINFALLNPEIFNSKNHSVNARNYTMFANACYGMKDLRGNLSLISSLAKGAFGEEEYISGKFTTFIENKLDQLPSPEHMLSGDWKTVKKELTDVIYGDGDTPNNGIANTLTHRFINHVDYYMKNSKSKTKGKDVLDRCQALLATKKEGKPLLSADLIFVLVRQMVTKYPTSFSKLMKDKDISAEIFG